MIELEQEKQKSVVPVATIKVMGVGGAGSNTVANIIESGCENIECIVINTDAQALELSKAPHKVQIGTKLTRGLGTGANPDLGRQAAEEDLDKIMEAVQDADIVFLAAGMGGGTGSGAMPIIAKALKERGILSVAVVTKPFLFEGKRRAAVAEKALAELKKEVDTLIIVPNQKLLEEAGPGISMIDAFSMINNILGQSVRGISDIISRPGHINVDFADVKTIMKLRGVAVMGSARASGEKRATEATLNAISSPLLENMSIEGAYGVLLNIMGGKNLGLHEINEAASVIYEQAHEDAHIILGSVVDESMGEEEVLVTVLATGFEHDKKNDCDEDGGSSDIKVTGSVRDNSHARSGLLAQGAEEAAPQESSEEKSEKGEQCPGNSEENKPKCDIQMQADEKKECEDAPRKEENISIDMNNLDIPTFLRRKE